MSDTLIVRPKDKSIVFIRTESRLWKISNRKIKTDGHIDENNGLIRKAVEVPASYVAELYARFGIDSKPKMKRRMSNMKQFQKEVV